MIAWLVGALAPALRVAGHSEASREASGPLLILLLVWVWLLGPRPARLQGPIQLAVLVAVATTAIVVTAPTMGRSPAILALAATTLAAFLLGHLRLRTPSPAPRWTAVLALAGAQVGWWATGSRWFPLLAALGFAASTTLWIRQPDLGASLDRRLANAFRFAAAASHRTATAAWTGAAHRGALLRRRATEARRDLRASAPREPHHGNEGRRTTVRAALLPAAVATLSAAATAPIWAALSEPAARFSDQINDLPNHIAVAGRFQFWPFETYSPHPLFPMLLRGVATVTSSDRLAAIIVLSAASAATGTILYLVARRSWSGRPGLGPWAAMTLPLAYLLVESPALLARAGHGWWERPLMDPIGTGPQIWVLHTWASPTSVLLLPLAIALVVAVADLHSPHEEGSGRRIGAGPLALLTIAATAAKPAVTLVLIVAAPMLWLLLPGRSQRPWRTLTLGLLLPGAAIASFQALFLVSGVTPEEQTSWRWDPFWLVERAQLHRPILWVPAVLPVAAAVIGGRRYVRDPAISLLMACVVVAFVPTFLLRETGTHANHANLAWTMIFSLILLLVFTGRFLLVELQDRRADDRSRSAPIQVAWVAIGSVAITSLAAGIHHYLVLVGAIPH